jgi:hypothetical protein
MSHNLIKPSSQPATRTFPISITFSDDTPLLFTPRSLYNCKSLISQNSFMVSENEKKNKQKHCKNVIIDRCRMDSWIIYFFFIKKSLSWNHITVKILLVLAPIFVVSAKCIVPWILEFVGWLVAWCLTSLSTIFQLYRGGQFYKIYIILIFFNVSISCVMHCLVLDTLMPSGEGIYIYIYIYLFLCPIILSSHHHNQPLSTFINDMLFFFHFQRLCLSYELEFRSPFYIYQ